MASVISVIVLRPFPYAGRRRSVDDRLQVPKREAAALIAAKLVREESDATPRKPQTYATRDLTAQPAAAHSTRLSLPRNAKRSGETSR